MRKAWADMADDEERIAHLETAHADQLAGLSWLPGMRKLSAGARTWGLFHDRLHRIWNANEPDHAHLEEGEMEKGRTLLELMWEELDAIVDRLMTDGAAEDGRDPGRAEGVAYCIALVTNPYEVDINEVRAEAMRRFNEAT